MSKSNIKEGDARPIAPLTKFFNWLCVPMIVVAIGLLLLTVSEWIMINRVDPIDIELKKLSPYEFPLMISFLVCCFFLLFVFVKYADVHLKLNWKQIFLLVFLSSMVFFFQFIYVARYTSIGIFALGGSKYWVHLAASYDDEKAKVVLAKAMNSNNYGVNNVENAVLSLPDAYKRYRLFVLLSAIAPNERWKKSYLARANDNITQEKANTAPKE